MCAVHYLSPLQFENVLHMLVQYARFDSYWILLFAVFFVAEWNEGDGNFCWFGMEVIILNFGYPRKPMS